MTMTTPNPMMIPQRRMVPAPPRPASSNPAGRTSMTVNGWVVTSHAVRRAAQMGLTVHQVIECLESPRTVDYPNSLRGPHAGNRTAWLGRIGVAYRPETRTILTVLWNTHEVTTR
jgi:hypothetical protein